jgi:hypothetical protein
LNTHVRLATAERSTRHTFLRQMCGGRFFRLRHELCRHTSCSTDTPSTRSSCLAMLALVAPRKDGGRRRARQTWSGGAHAVKEAAPPVSTAAMGRRAWWTGREARGRRGAGTGERRCVAIGLPGTRERAAVRPLGHIAWPSRRR